MLFSEAMRMALLTLWNNKLRSLLTMLGIIIGVASVIAMVSIGLGVRQQVKDSIASLGSNMLIVTAGADRGPGRARRAAGSANTLKLEDAIAIKHKLNLAKYVSPLVQRSYQVVNGNQNWNTQVVGVWPEYMNIRSLTVANGSFITPKDEEQHARVAVIGTTVAENLFGEINPVGKMIRINNAPFKVVGLLDSKGQSPSGQDQDDMVIIPLSTAINRMLGIDYVYMINIEATAEDKLEPLQYQVEELLRQRHHIVGNMPEDFTVRNLTSVMETATQSTNMITVLLGSIAGISLLVGGIGIMNIMLVSVTERTKEIGIRKALGATYNNIMLQFLVEAIFVGIVGGILGIILGCIIALLIGQLTGINTLITPLPIIVAFSFSVAISLFFGIYPARKAARLDPIDALRYE